MFKRAEQNSARKFIFLFESGTIPINKPKPRSVGEKFGDSFLGFRLGTLEKQAMEILMKKNFNASNKMPPPSATNLYAPQLLRRLVSQEALRSLR
ncbi:MAG: hypothetical protein ABI042_13125 [Verrucomicrobiota bacterium]